MARNSLLAGAPYPLDLPTYDGSGQCVHPDVICVYRAFYGFELLMVVEPYPFADDYFENPSILVSNNSIDWFTPNGVINPIVEPPSRRGAWNSDADLLFDQDGALSLYYRYNSGDGETTLFRKTTEDGSRWGPPERILSFDVSGEFASPSFIRFQDKIHIFYVDTLRQTVRCAESTDGTRWHNDRLLFEFPGAWHIDAVVSGEWIYLLLNNKKSLFLLRSLLLDSWSILDGDGWRNFSNGISRNEYENDFSPLLSPTKNSWDDEMIYRSTFIINARELQLWYGAKSTQNVWKVGYINAQVAE